MLKWLEAAEMDRVTHTETQTYAARTVKQRWSFFLHASVQRCTVFSSIWCRIKVGSMFVCNAEGFVTQILIFCEILLNLHTPIHTTVI